MPNQRMFDGRSSAFAAAGKRVWSRPKRKAAPRTGFRYLKSRDFPIHLLVAWWVFWLVASYTGFNEFIPPSGQTLGQYALLLVSFLFGYLTIKHMRAIGLRARTTRTSAFPAGSTRMRVALRAAALTCAVMLLISLQLSGAFSSDFIEYFAKLRMDEGGLESLTGIRALDVLTKILAFPLSYTVIVVVLANGVQRFRFALLLCIFNLLAFSYLWQVNYPLIHLFWFLVFHSLVQAHRRGSFDKRTMVIVLVLFSTLLASAANRFGGDVLGGLQRYIVGYHLIGFSFYDHQYLNPNSILHVHSFGRSSLGFLDQMLEAVSKMVGAAYKAASFENATYNNDTVDIGVDEVKEFNAFGTLLFGLYRDFHFVGILIGGFAYGALTTRALYRSTNNWANGALFMILASSWMMGMMVNPLEQAYFWFAIVAIGLFGLVNRGVRY
jgi:oligosaccharide repeat unit polymerase